MSETKPSMARAEMLAGALVTGWVVVLHVINLFRAGPLWRDEVGAVDFASMPAWGDIWRNLRYDNYPPLFAGVARLWTMCGWNSDFGYRTLGFLVGMGTLAAFWWCVRKLGGGVPLLGLALYATSPVAVRYGDSLRPYGLGIVLTSVALTLVWRFVEAPGRTRLLWAILGAILSAQCLYQNAFFILAFCCGAWVVALGRRDGKVAWQAGLIGFVAAISLLPYLGNIRMGEEWRVVLRSKIPFDSIFVWLNATLRRGGAWMNFVWLIALVATLIFGLLDRSKDRKEWRAYGGTVLTGSAVFYLGYLVFLYQPPRLWYFLSLMAPVAIVLDSILGGTKNLCAHLGRIIFSIVVAVACIPASYSQVKIRQSNIDLAAAALKANVQPNDYVIVNPWYFGVSLQRYLDSKFWTTLPPIEDLRIHRYDLLRREMERADAIGPVLKRTEETLRAGHSVWVVGELNRPPDRNRPKVLPPYHAGMKEAEGAYCANWAFQEAHLLALHVQDVNTANIPVPNGQAISPYEDVHLMVFRGWHD